MIRQGRRARIVDSRGKPCGFGIFYNVNANSGTFGILTSAGNASTSSASYDTSTFVFAGLISTTPFTSAEIFSNSGGAGTASYNIPEIALKKSGDIAE